jgi:hypothetical protein
MTRPTQRNDVAIAMRKERQHSSTPDELPPFERPDERSLSSDSDRGRSQGEPRHLTNGSVPGRVNGLSVRGRVNGLVNGFTNGRINGLRNGRINGLINGFTNGRVNGLRNGRINGLVNGFTNGRINGLKDGKQSRYNGLVNGLEHKTGLVNGNSFINGFRMPGARRRMPLSKKNSSLRLAVVLAMVALVVITPFLLIFSMPESAIKIDGYFFDWERAGYFQEMKATAASDVDIRGYSTVVGQGVLYGYISTADNMFSLDNGEPTALYGFFDMDNNPGTGYIIDGIGADKMVEIMGWNGTMKSATVSDFLVGFERMDFSGFAYRMPVDAIPADNKIEFSFHMSGTQNPAALFMSKNVQGQEDASQYTVRFGEPALKVMAELVMPDVIPVDSRERVMDLGFESVRGNFTITGLTFEKLGTASNYRISAYDDLQVIGYSNGAALTFEPALEIKEGYGRSLSIYVEIDGSEISSSFGLSLNATGIGTLSGPATVDEIQVSNRVAYVSEVPHSVVIDGAFADWRYGFIMIDNANDVRLANGSLINDPSIDITGYGMYIDQKDVAMYLSVADRIFNGTSIPKNITIPVPTEGLPNIEGQQLIGADIAGAMLDTDLDPSTGARFSDTFGADYLVFITGKKGRIIQSELYAWDASQVNATWRFVERVSSAVDSKRMEFAFNFSALSMSDLDVAAVSFFMTDWKAATDYSDGILPLAKWQIGMYSKAFGGILINEVYNIKGTSVDWIELFNTGSQSITLTGWVIYDGTTAVYTFGAITIAPGDFIVVYDLSISKNGNLRLANAGGQLIDSVTAKESSTTKSFSRIGSPPYATWRNTVITPGALNAGQVPIPEFSDILVPLIGIIGAFTFIKARRRKVKDG